MSITPPLYQADDIVTKYTDYAANVPDYFIDFIKDEIALRDVPGLTSDRIKAVNVTGEHPLVRMTETVLTGGKLNTAGFLPAISVIEDEENESYESLGDGWRTPLALTQTFVDDCRALAIQDRAQEGLLSNKQLDMIEAQIAVNAALTADGVGAVLALLEGFYLQERAFVSVWAHSVDERNYIGNTMRSILYDMKKHMKLRKLKDIHIRTAKGLVNTNFGRILHGQETTIDYVNFFHNITVTKEVPLQNLLDETNNISIFDAINQSTEEITKNLDVGGRFIPVGHPDEGIANTNEGDIE